MKKMFLVIFFVLFAGALYAQDFNKAEKKGFIVEWTVTGENLSVRLTAPTQGWLAIGFGPEKKMQGANIIIAYVKNDELFIRDDYGNSQIAHKEDKSSGGTDNIISASGFEKDKTTTVEFQIPLDSGDTRDKALVPGNTYKIIIASGRSDNFTSRHNFDAELEIKI